MLPFELPFDVVLIVAIVIITISYALLLVKLKPSIKNEESASPSETLKSFRPQKNPKEQAMNVESKKDVQTEAHAETAEAEAKQEPKKDEEAKQEPKKDEEAKKSFFLFGERNFEGCPHKFGYLRSLPKNTPIPDECFGCPQIIECLRTLKNK